jgi:transposase
MAGRRQRAEPVSAAGDRAAAREQIGRSSRNSSKPPSSDGPGFKPSERRKGSGHKRGGQQGHAGSGPELLASKRVDEVVEHHPDACRRCGTLLEGEDGDALRHQVIEIPPITPVVIEHRLHRLVCPCCSRGTCATLPLDVEANRYGPLVSALVGMLEQLLGVTISRSAIVAIRKRLCAALEQPSSLTLEVADQQPVAYVDETGAQGRLKVRRKAAGAAMVEPVLSGLLPSVGRPRCHC